MIAAAASTRDVEAPAGDKAVSPIPPACLNPPAHATLDDAFRCTQWSCKLTLRACLKRQSATLGHRRPRPLDRFCAAACQAGASIAERFGKAEPTHLGTWAAP